MLRTLILFSAIMAIPAAARPRPGEVEIPSSGRVDGTINGKPARFLVSPIGSKVPLLNPDAARQAGLSPGWLNFAVFIGPVKVIGHTGVVRYTAPGTALRRRIGWFERPVAPGFDGMIGPAGLSASIVTFRLRPSRAGENITRLPLIDGGYGGMRSEVRVDKERVGINWLLDQDDSTASAQAGTLLRQQFAGAWSGPIVQRQIFLGVARPLRQMTLARPFVVGDLRLSSLLVRSSETDKESDDPDEIVVTAKGKKAGPAFISIGRDALSRCSTLTFDKPRKEVRLSCL